jgi:hypothetical protein
MTTDQLKDRLAARPFRPFKLVLKVGAEIYVRGDNEYAVSENGTMVLVADLRQIRPSQVERIEPLPYNSIKEDRRDIAAARRALREMKRRGLIPWDGVKNMLGLAGRRFLGAWSFGDE